MVTKVVPVDLGEIVTAGDDYNLTLNLTKDGSATGWENDLIGATVTCSIREVGATVALTDLEDHAVQVSDGANGITNLILLDTETDNLVQPSAANHLATIQHIADVLVVEAGGNETHCGPFTFDVRRALT